MKKDLENAKFTEYLKETRMLDYYHPDIQILIVEKGWKELDTYHKIEQIYSFVQNEILFGYNKGDTIPASEVLSDGIGQCNTKATLLMALLRAVDIPSRFHAFSLRNCVQKGAIPEILFPLAPKTVIHTWAEVWYDGDWRVLEGVILDLEYLHKVQQMQKSFSSTINPSENEEPVFYEGYGIGIDNLYHPPVDWKGENTYIQYKGIVSDYGIYDCPDDFFVDHSQDLRPWKRWICEHFTYKSMTKRVNKIRMS